MNDNYNNENKNQYRQKIYKDALSLSINVKFIQSTHIQRS